MDAISFVLGLDAKRLRATKLDELVNGEAHKSSKLHAASVTMYFIDNSGDDDVEHVFTRSLVSKKGVTNEKTYSDTYSCQMQGEEIASGKKAYIAALEQIGITVDIPNCLVFQVR